MTKLTAKALSTAALVLLAAPLLAGCSSADSRTPALPDGNSSSDLGPSTSSFDGPWADSFARIAQSPDSTEKQRSIVSDGVITEQEYNEVRSDFVNCLADLGAEATLSPNGGFSVSTDGRLNASQIQDDAVPTCEAQTMGRVASLYEEMRRNPTNEDEAVLMADCLKKKGVVGDSYTAAQYRKDLDSNTGIDFDSDEVRDCSVDPLGLLRDGR